MPASDLRRLQEESQRQALPAQEKTFALARRVRSRLTHVPDSTHPPLGYEPGRGFDGVFPFIGLPELRPTLNGDWVQFGSPDLAPNLLYHGDNLQVLRTLPSESIDLIYIDPPFFSGAVYNVIWGDANEVRTFNDIWDGGMDTYLVWLNARLWEMRRVLKSTGSIYVHCDWHASHYIKTEMDRIFGYENFLTEIVWNYGSASGGRSKGDKPVKAHDVIQVYAKSYGSHAYNRLFLSYDEKYIRERFAHVDQAGRHYQKRKRGEGRYEHQYLDESPGVPMPTVWSDIKQLYAYHLVKRRLEEIGYPTQKPQALLERIVSMSSPLDGIVADFFCGGGTTIAAAQKLGRRWIASDISRVAVSVTLDRLVKVCEEQSGVVSNYGKASGTEIQRIFPKAKVPDIRVCYVGVYPMDRFKAVDEADFARFILKCYDASPDTSGEPISGWRTQLEPVLVGPADPEQTPATDSVKAFFEASLKHLQPNTRMKARVLAWKFSPQLIAYRKDLLAWIAKNLPARGVAMDLDYVPINSQEFRERIVRKYPEASENEFFLRFTQPPIVGGIGVKRLGKLRYRFEATDACAVNLDGYLVNCQWDFDFQRGHFAAHPDYVLGRRPAETKDRKFEAVLVAEHEFSKAGTFAVACRIQDNLGGEVIKPVEVEAK